jgi:4-methylaminobutanoate oxidase (formaldehyde-forming)
MHWPYKQHKTSRNQKLFPYHEELKKAGACFGVSAGYERPMWFALNNEKSEFKYSYNHQNWYTAVEFETKNARENVGLFDLTAFSKYDLKGQSTHNELQKICTANVKDEIGKTTYTQMLNKDGGIETDLTVVCLGKNYFRIITSAANREHDKFHILKHLSKEVDFKDVTDEITCLGVFGPKSRSLMSRLSKEDLSNENFKFGTGKKITIKDKEVWAQRLSYVGELGWELYIKMNEAREIYNLIIETGKEFNLSHCGMLAMDTMRMESGYLHWGHDMSPEENQYQAGLQFAISYKKNIDFIGKEALLKIKDKKQNKKLVMLVLKDSKPGEPLLLHDEPIYNDKDIIGRTTSGNFSFNYNKNIAFGYINSDFTKEELLKQNLFIEVEKKKYSVSTISKPLNSKNIKLL